MAFNVRQIFSALNDAGADYVVVGGLAGRERDREDIAKLRTIRDQDSGATYGR